MRQGKKGPLCASALIWGGISEGKTMLKRAREEKGGERKEMSKKKTNSPKREVNGREEQVTSFWWGVSYCH